MSDFDIVARAQGLVAIASKEAPLTPTRYARLKADVDELAKGADDPEQVLEVVGEQLEWLKPGGDAQDPDYE